MINLIEGVENNKKMLREGSEEVLAALQGDSPTNTDRALSNILGEFFADDDVSEDKPNNPWHDESDEEYYRNNPVDFAEGDNDGEEEEEFNRMKRQRDEDALGQDEIDELFRDDDDDAMIEPWDFDEFDEFDDGEEDLDLDSLPDAYPARERRNSTRKASGGIPPLEDDSHW